MEISGSEKKTEESTNKRGMEKNKRRLPGALHTTSAKCSGKREAAAVELETRRQRQSGGQTARQEIEAGTQSGEENGGHLA